MEAATGVWRFPVTLNENCILPFSLLKAGDSTVNIAARLSSDSSCESTNRCAASATSNPKAPIASSDIKSILWCPFTGKRIPAALMQSAP